MSLFQKIVGTILVSWFLVCCASTGGGSANNVDSSKPINDLEARQYKKALLRCYKTGGSRIVKINGSLRCF